MGFELLAGRDHSAHPELAFWHGNIGHPVALDLAPPASPEVKEIDLLCWNLAIGKAYLDELIARLRTPAFGQVSCGTERPFILLAQEALRSDPSVPEHPKDHFHGGHIPVGTRRDIVDFAAEHNFSLRYAPSMRNGKHRSDRGNAIVSNVAIKGARAFVLPYIKQRRVVVKAEIEALPWLTFVSAHLDVGGRLPGAARIGRYGAGRAGQTTELVKRLDEMNKEQSFVLGADLNTALGARDPAFRVFLNNGFTRAKGSERIKHTFHGPVRFLLDHLVYRSPGGRIEAVEVTRLDERRDDKGRSIFGSDHHPLLVRIHLRH